MSPRDVTDLDPNALVALDALLETKSVTLAARRLGITQSAMSHRLGQLRRQIGDPLLVGGRSGLVPTPRAVAIEQPLRRALADLVAAVRVGEPFDAARSTRRFVVAADDYGELVALPAVMRTLHAEAPRVTLSMEPLDHTLTARLASGAVDIAVTVRSDLPTSLRQATIAKDPYAVALRAGHPALGRGMKKLTLRSYVALDHLVVAPRRLPGSVVDAALAKRGYSRTVALRVQSFVAAPFIIAQTDLITTLGSTLLAAASRYVGLEILAPPIALAPSEIVMVWHERAQVDPGHRWLRGQVAGSLSDSRPRRSAR